MGDLPEKMQAWLSTQPTIQCLVNREHCLHVETVTDSEFCSVMKYQAILRYLSEFPNERVQQLRPLVKQLCLRLVERAEEKRNLFLLSGKRPGQTSLAEIFRRYHGIKEVRVAQELFGQNGVVPIHCLLDIICSDDVREKLSSLTDRGPFIRELYEARVKELEQQVRRVSEEELEQVRKQARVEEAQEAKQMKGKKKAPVKSTVSFAAIEQAVKSIRPGIWTLYVRNIVHALRNTSDSVFRVQNLAYQYCPTELHYRVRAHFKDKITRLRDPLSVIKFLSQQSTGVFKSTRT